MSFVGLILFLPDGSGDKEEDVDGVNALRRAYSISTVPSENPLFMRLPRPIFASNSQNILKIHVFCPFLGLVSYFSIFNLKQHPFTFLKLYIPSKNSSIIKYTLLFNIFNKFSNLIESNISQTQSWYSFLYVSVPQSSISARYPPSILAAMHSL